jgi:hypothetical protein
MMLPLDGGAQYIPDAEISAPAPTPFTIGATITPEGVIVGDIPYTPVADNLQPLVPTFTSGPINNPIIDTPQSVVSALNPTPGQQVNATWQSAGGAFSLLNLFDTIGGAYPAPTQATVLQNTGVLVPAISTPYDPSWKNADQPSGGSSPAPAPIIDIFTPTPLNGNAPVADNLHPIVSTTSPAPQDASTNPLGSLAPLFNLFDALTARNVPSATQTGATPGSGVMVIPGTTPAATGGISSVVPSSYTGWLLVVAVVGLLVTLIVYRKKIVSEVKDAV